MILVIDSNILISAFIKDSYTRKIIVGSGLNLCFPEVSLGELKKHEKMILMKSGLSKKDYDILVNKLLEYVVLIPDEEFKKHLQEAKETMMEIDPDDVVFIATALAFKNSVIWSDDKDFEKQNKVVVINTNQLIKLFQI